MSAITINIVKNGYVVNPSACGGFMPVGGGTPAARVATTIDEALGYVREELEAAKAPKPAGIFSGLGGQSPLAMMAEAVGVPVEALQKILREKIGGLDPKDPFDLGDLHPDNDGK